MRRAAWLLAMALGWPLLGCVGLAYRPPPGPRPLPEPWNPSAELRERVPRAEAGEVVLDERDGLSPEEAAVLAVDRNPRLRAARAERGIGRAELLAAGVLPNPRLASSLDAPVSGKDANVLGYGAELSWNVTPLLSRSARVSAAEESLSSIDLDIAWQEWQVAQAARLHAVRASYLERRATLAHELEETWQRRLDALRQARAARAVTELEVTDAESAYAEARVSRLDLEQQVAAERAQLSRAIGADPARDLVLDVSFTAPAGTPSRETVLDQIPRRRLDLIALQHAHRSHDEALRAAVLARFPPVAIGLRTDRGVDDNVSAGVVLSFEIPFFDRNQAAVARERARRTQLGAEYEARLLAARADALRTLKALDLVAEQLAAARDASEAGGRLAEQARAAAVGGALSPLVAADVLRRSYASRLRALAIEQTRAELRIALALASGMDVR